MASTFPFAAIVGQDEMIMAIQVVAIDPSVGGVLVLGDRGTGKSTAVRALADLLPPIQVVKGCPYKCDPNNPAQSCAACSAQANPPGGKAHKLPAESRAVSVVDLPLGATEQHGPHLPLSVDAVLVDGVVREALGHLTANAQVLVLPTQSVDRKSTRLNSSH